VAQTGARLADFHLIGHGVGAHTAGFAGKRITGTQLGRITGLCYSVDKASFVSIHSLPCETQINPNRFTTNHPPLF
jgi:hypothetical protein